MIPKVTMYATALVGRDSRGNAELDRPQAHRKLKQPGALDHTLGRRQIAGNLKTEHRAKAALHLPPG